MDDEAFFTHLQSTCADAVEGYRAKYADAPH